MGVTSESNLGWKISVNALIESHEGVLLVDPSYKQGWDLPGGILDLGESPVDGLKRELMEELNVPVEVGPLRCVDYIHSDWERRSVIMMIFSASIDLDIVRADREEVLDWAVFSRNDTLEKVSTNMQKRLTRVWSENSIYGESP